MSSITASFNRQISPRIAIRGLLLIVVTSAAIVVPPRLALAQAESPVATRIREAVTVNSDSGVFKKLNTVREYFDAGQWEPAIDMLRQIYTEDAQALLAVEPGRYLSVPRYGNLLMASLPAEGLKACRLRLDPQARRWFEQAVASRQEAPLQRIVKQAYVSSVTDDALNLLAEWAWERGDVAAARGYWEQLIPITRNDQRTQLLLRYPDSELPRETTLARLVLCSIAEADSRRAKLEIEAFAKQFPKAEGTLAGKRGKLAEILVGIASEAADWETANTLTQVTTFGVNAERNRVLPNTAEVNAVAWSVPLSPPPTFAFGKPTMLRSRGPLCFVPVVWRNVVFVNDADRILAWNVDTGQPAWPADEGSDAAIYPAIPADTPPEPTRPIVGQPWFTLTIHEDRLYARMGSPITGRAVSELSDLASDLVCLDLKQEGLLLWKLSAAELDGEQRGWRFEGTPIVSGDRLYVALRRNHPQTQLNIACLDAATGRLVWNRNVCNASTSFGAERNVASHLLLTLGGNSLFLSTDVGAIAALDCDDGAPQWILTYESKLIAWEKAAAGGPSDGLTPCVYHRGTLFAAPADSDKLMAIDAATGLVKWSQPVTGSIQHLLGVGGGHLIATGDDLWGFEVYSGKRWHIGGPDPEGRGYGRGILAGDVVYWPTREEILTVDQRTGTIVRRILLHTVHGQSGGNLVLAPRHLLIAQPDRLVAFGDAAQRADPPANKVVNLPDVFEFFHRDQVATNSIRLVSTEEGDSNANHAVAATVEQEPTRIAPPKLPWSIQWGVPLGDGESAIVPEGLAADCVLKSGRYLECVDRRHGKVRWKSNIGAPLRWSASIGQQLLMADQNSLRAVDPDTGQARWERYFDPIEGDSQSGSVLPAVAENVVIIRSASDSLIAVDQHSGETVWQYRAPGTINGFSTNDAKLVCATLSNPGRVVVLSAIDGTRVAERKLSVWPTQSRANWFGGARIAVLANDRKLNGISIASDTDDWVENGPSSHAFADPDIKVFSGIPYVVIDGDSLVRLDPTSGRRRWTRGLGARLPMDGTESLVGDEDAVLAVTGGQVRCINAGSGAVEWLAELPVRLGDYGVILMDELFVAFAATSESTGNSPIFVGNRSSGRLIQKLNVAAHGIQKIHPGLGSTVVLAKDCIIGLGSSASLTERND